MPTGGCRKYKNWICNFPSTHKAAFDALKRQRTAIRTSRFPDRKFDSNIFANVERPKVETTEATENQPKVQPAQPETIESDEHFVGGFEEKMTFEEACLILGLSPKYVVVCYFVDRLGILPTLKN